MPSAAQFDRHGQIRCGTISVKSLDQSLALYCDYLHQQVVEEGEVATELAQAWGVASQAGSRYAILKPQAEIDPANFLRLVEVPDVGPYAAAKSLGWNAFEITVRDVFSLAADLESSDFKIVGPPKLVDGFTSFIPMQVVGPDGEVLFLNQVNHSDDDTDLPSARCPVDQIFIVVLASSDREASADEYAHRLNLDRAATHSLRYSLINRAFDLPMETQQTITLIQNKRMPFAQIDQYPQNAETRPQHEGWLPAGNSMVSVMVESMDDLPIADRVIGPAIYPKSSIYQGRRTQVIKGSASELIELIEIS